MGTRIVNAIYHKRTRLITRLTTRTDPVLNADKEDFVAVPADFTLKWPEGGWFCKFDEHFNKVHASLQEYEDTMEDLYERA